ncbi:MAG: InlB B-repeat-containing protein, partial [Clostridia bacterium]|nr:InlB B-repeat-containing protein [Clostridia bacterium]
MNLAKTKEKYLKCAILIISICFILGALSACLPFSIFIPDKLEEDAINDTAMAITKNPSDGLGEFNNGYSYVYTDKDLIDKYRAGDSDTPYDITPHKVNKTDINRGTQDNPYVISSTDDWETFVKRMETDTTHGSGQYYVLGADLDFTGVTFHPVRFFNGTFYGMGHTIKNISCDSWKYYNNGTTLTDIAATTNGFGLFCRTSAATVTDLIVDNFSYREVPQITLIEGRISHTGGIIGLATGDDLVLNCHTQGEVTKSAGITSWMCVGGVVGGIYTYSVTNKSIKLYRCSSQLKVEVNPTSASAAAGPQIGGIIGDGYNKDTIVSIYIYDCVANVKGNTTCTNHYMGSIMGHNSIGSIHIENVIGNIDITSVAQMNAGGLIAINRNASNTKIKNCYQEGKVGQNDSSKLSMYAVCGGYKITNASNINVVKSTSSYASFGSTTFGDSLSNLSTEPHEYSTTNLLISKAKSDVGTYLPSQIWDESKIGGYTPDNSPVRNYLMAFINFRNLLSSNSDGETVGIDDGVGYVVGDALPTDDTNTDFSNWVSANKSSQHIFKGWTDDATGSSEPFTELPSGYFGEVTLYAVWGLSDDYVKDNIKTSLTSDKDKIEYDSVESITLTALVEHTSTSGGMTSPSAKYYIKQDNKDKVTNSTGKLSVKTVADSGLYTFNYRITDSNEPLWYYDGKHTIGKRIEIEKGKLTSMTLNDFKIDEATIPYYGKPLSEIDFTCTVKNKANVNVEIAESGWEVNIYTVAKGTNKFNIVIKPTDTDNYEASYMFPVEFDSKALQMIFNIHQFSDEKLTHDIEYGKSIASGTVIAYFEEVYLNAMNNKWDETRVNFLLNSSYAPYLNGAPITPDSGNGAIFSENYTNVKEELTIEVTFEKAVYNITYLDSNGVTISQEQQPYGQNLIPPEDPTNSDDSYLFVGWYFDTKDEAGNAIRRAWRYQPEGGLEPDRVTGNTELKAEWIRPNQLDSIEVTYDPSKIFMALTEIKEGDLTVKAHFSGVAEDGTKVYGEKLIPWGDYTITYGGSGAIDHKLHVTDGGAPVTVKYTYGAWSKDDTVNLPVQAIKIDTSGLDFGQNESNLILREANGEAQNVKGPDKSEYVGLQITDIEYEYYDGITKVNPEDVIEAGDYTVRVIFKVKPDYEADTLVLTLRIGTFTEVTIVWDYDDSQPYMYNGKPQAPTAKVYRSNGTEITNLNLNYTGDTEVSSRGSYTISVEIVGGSYKIVEGESCDFRIVKAVLDAPTLKDDTAIVYDGSEKRFENLFNIDTNLIDIASGGLGTDAGNYTAILSLKDTVNCEWSSTSGATGNTVQVKWTIEKAHLTAVWNGDEHVSDGNEFTPSVVDFVGIAGVDRNAVDFGNDITYEGDIGKSEVGAYSIKAILNGNATWAKNYILDGNVEWAYVIIPQEGMQVVTIEWGETELIFNGKVQMPTYTVLDKDGNDITEQVKG